METNTSLIVTAHPDDETIFFAGLILSRPKSNWKVICVTDGDADGEGKQRLSQLESACQKLGVSDVENLCYKDRFEQRLPVEEIYSNLNLESCSEVFTHGPTGEYGHPHHQDVSMAVHKAFFAKAPVFSIAFNCEPDIEVRLAEKEFKIKQEIYSQIYLSETKRFFQMLPCSWTEGFCKLQIEEVESLYDFFAKGKLPDISKLKKYLWLSPYFDFHNEIPRERPF